MTEEKREAIRAALRKPPIYGFRFLGGHKPAQWGVYRLDDFEKVPIACSGYEMAKEVCLKMNEDEKLDAIMELM